MTLDEIEQRLHEAITTLAALPDREQRWLRAKLVSWPATLREAADVIALWYERKTRGEVGFELAWEPCRAVPPPDAIDRMDTDLDWLRWLSPDQQTLVFMRASSISWVKIAAKFKTTEYFVKKWYSNALERIAYECNKQRPSPPLSGLPLHLRYRAGLQ